MGIIEILIQKTGDQIFSIVLLVVFAMVSWKKQQKTDDRLNKYIAEDREEMKDIISNNTRVMESICSGGCATLNSLNNKHSRQNGRKVNTPNIT